MLIMNDGTKVKAGMAFETKTGVVSFIVLTVHHDDTVTFAGEKQSFKRPYSNVWASRGETMRVSFDKFKEIHKRFIESEHERAAKIKAAEKARMDRVFALENDHEQALRMDLLVRASKGEDLNALLEEFDSLVKREMREKAWVYAPAG